MGSVTVHGSIYRGRRMAQLLDPDRDFSWLTEIENDLAAAMQPQPKLGRLVYSHVLVKAGTDLMTKAEAAMHRSSLARASNFAMASWSQCWGIIHPSEKFRNA